MPADRITGQRRSHFIFLTASRLFMTEQEYNECVTTYADNVYRFILKNLRHEEYARAVVQTAFEKMWRNRENVDA